MVRDEVFSVGGWCKQIRILRQMKSSRRRFLVLASAAMAAPRASLSQQAIRFARIGYLLVPSQAGIWDARLQAFRERLATLGWVEGRNMELLIRSGEGSLERMPALASEVVAANVDVIVAVNSPTVLAVRAATRTIPIVMPLSSDPVGDGLVATLAHPGGNITGFSLMSPELGEKRLQLLREVFPKSSRAVAVIWNPAYVGMRARYVQAKSAAPALGVDVRSVEVRDTGGLESAFEGIVREHPDALLLLADPLTVGQRQRIVDFAAQHRLPAIYESSDFVDAGGLMSYGPSALDLFRRAASYVDKILRGAKPGDLPIEQPEKFELILNMKAARALGIKFPESILLRADKVIE
jgi:putative ABC transport system substrate-binding protein